MKTREEILSYEDEELINYYDECIEVFVEYNSKWNKMIKLKNKSLMKNLPIMCLVTMLIVSVFAVLMCFHSILLTYLPMPKPDGTWISERFTPIYASDEDYQLEMVKERKRYVSILLVTLSVLVGLIILVLGLKRRLGSQITKAFNEFDTYRSNLYQELDNPPERLANALLVFETIDIRIPQALRKIVFDCVASTHREAQIELRREIERSEDKKWRQEMAEAIHEISKKDMLDKLEQIGNIKQWILK